MRKKVIFFIFTFLVVIIISIFIKNNYKNFKIGNNENNKSVKEVEEYILNIQSYNAVMDVNIKSNKNQNKYILSQEYKKNGEKKQRVIKPENIEGTEVVFSGDSVQISNSKLNLNKIYSSYPFLSDNVLWLGAFCETYMNKKEDAAIYEDRDYIVMQISQNDNKYFNLWKLYLEKGTGKPKKMVVQDDNKNEIIYILYTKIDLY